MPIFLANAYLFFGLVALVPLMLHLLHRKRPQPVMFAAMRFISDAIAKSRRSRRVTQCLTLLMRILIILLLALAFSRPVMKFSRFVPGNHRTVLIVLDSSASMHAREGGKTLFETSRSWAESLINGLDEGDRVGLLAPGGNVVSVVYPPVSDHLAVLGALRDLRAAYGHGDLAAALADCLEKSRDDLQGMEIHVFSDFQKDGWTKVGVERVKPKLESLGVAVFFNRAATVTTGDSGIAKADFTPPAIIADGGLAVGATIKANDQYAGNAVLRLGSDAGELNHTALELMPGEDRMASMTVTPAGEGPQLAGSLTLERDAYELNNSFYYSLPRVKGVPALVVNGGSERDGFFLKNALNPGGKGASLLQPVEVDWATFLANEAGDYQVAFICNPPDLGEAARTRIKALLSGGHTVILFPGELNGITQDGLRGLEALATITAKRADFPETRRQEVGMRDRHGQMAQRLNAVLPPPWGFPARSRLKLSMGPDKGETVLDCEGDAFALSASQDGGKLWVFALAANRDWSDWPVTPFFLVAMQELARDAAGGRARPLSCRVGSSLALPWQGRETSMELEVLDPAGAASKISVTRKTLSQPFLVSGLDKPGIYTLGNGRITMRAAVNIPFEEVILDYMRQDDLTGSLPGISCAFTTNESQLKQKIDEMRQGSPLWPPLLALAFFLSIIEVIFANIRSRSVDRPRLVSRILGNGGAGI